MAHTNQELFRHVDYFFLITVSSSESSSPQNVNASVAFSPIFPITDSNNLRNFINAQPEGRKEEMEKEKMIRFSPVIVGSCISFVHVASWVEHGKLGIPGQLKSPNVGHT